MSTPEFTAENNLTIIPARGGSKRVPNKNKKFLVDKPLIAWTLEAAQACPELGRILVSTDDREIASIAEDWGVKVPWLREGALATDDAQTKDVVLDCVERHESESGSDVQWVTLLQPTSPFRGEGFISRGVSMFRKGGGDTLVTVAEQTTPLEWMVHLGSDGALQDPQWSSDKYPLYYYSGSMYIISRTTLEKTADLYSNRVLGMTVEDPVEAIDIDTPADWRMAELVARGLTGNH